VADHWEADLCAIGIASHAAPGGLVYVRTFGRAPGRYAYECESPPTESDAIYAVTGRGEDVTFDELLAILVTHLAG
jgi:hypothetical protein